MSINLRYVAEISDEELMLLRCMWRSSEGCTLSSLAEEVLLRYGVRLSDEVCCEAMLRLMKAGYAGRMSSDGSGWAGDSSGLTGDDTVFGSESGIRASGESADVLYDARIKEDDFREACETMRDELWKKLKV